MGFAVRKECVDSQSNVHTDRARRVSVPYQPRVSQRAGLPGLSPGTTKLGFVKYLYQLPCSVMTAMARLEEVQPSHRIGDKEVGFTALRLIRIF